MKNISENDGLSRKKRQERSSVVIPLQVLEDDFPVLLARVLHRSDKFASYYRYQPLVILSEIESFNLSIAEDTYHGLKDKEQKAKYVRMLVMRMEDWRKRLEYACIEGKPLELLRDINGQAVNNASGVGKRHFFTSIMALISMLQQNSDNYREEIYSSGMMDPSLAVIIATLKNYKDIATNFNQRWHELPYVYMRNMLGASRRPAIQGSVWLAFDKDHFPPTDASMPLGYKLLSETPISALEVKSLDMIVLEYNKDRHPESALNYATSLSRIDIFENSHNPVATGIQLQSNVLLLKEGERNVFITFKLVKASVDFFKSLITCVSSVCGDGDRMINPDEALYKILNDAFILEATISGEWRRIDSFHACFRESERSFIFHFHLSKDIPALEPLDGEDLSSVRLSVNNTAWLFPYSWARTLFFESVHIKAEVKGLRDILLYNELGPIDSKQSFAPFGLQAEKGGWLVFGSPEMACKHITRLNFSFDWQQLPDYAGGLRAYYQAYNQKKTEEITNRSFQARAEYLQNHEWKRIPDDMYYIFHTKHMENGMPEPDGRLIDQCSISFDVPDMCSLSLPTSDDFRFGAVQSGFYRLTLASPDMGFGGNYYRRLFTDVMMFNSHSRKKRPVPDIPIAPLMNNPRLNYTAEEECFFTIGQIPPMRISYLNPLSIGIMTLPDTTCPIAMLQGPEDEGNLIIAFDGAIGQTFFRVYVDMELLQREINHDELPETFWYYKSDGKWSQLPSSGVLRDDTGHLMHSGVVELQLPRPVSEEILDDDGLFRICVSVRRHLHNCSVVRNIYVNVAEAEVTATPDEETTNPLINGVRQITPVQGAIPAETDVDIKVRISERISHRNRALLPEDYEQMVLQAFPEIAKVKCFSDIDTKGRGRSGVVTLALVNDTPHERLPLCDDFLLCKVEDYLQQYVSPFVTVDVINPVYEEITVFCGLSVRQGYSAGVAIADVRKCINDCVAPWYDRQEVPVFGYSFSMHDLFSQIRESKYINQLHGIKLAHLTEDIHGAYYLNKGMSEEIEKITLIPSAPWAILIPAVQQYIIICSEEEWRDKIEYGDLEVGRTFVIG